MACKKGLLFNVYCLISQSDTFFNAVIFLFLQAVRHLHNHKLVHMDIKPDNIFIGFDGLCKLGDFGLVIDLSQVRN